MIRLKPGRFDGLIKSRDELQHMRDAGRELASVRRKILEAVAPGISTKELDQIAQSGIEELGAKPAFLNYRGFPATICASINEEVVHGIPSSKRKLREGDIVSIDVGLIHYGFYSDTAVTVAVGEISDQLERLLQVTSESLDKGIAAFQKGNRLGDISSAIQKHAEGAGFSVVKEYTGHAIGREMHEDPRIKNFGMAGTGLRLREGMVFALEPMVNVGVGGTRELEDGWTVVTADRKPSAHFEHTVALTADGPEILTKE
ncbi:MAG: type I methionyl aminopeptidase [Candidatus Sumerlaeia bacterium]